MIEILKQSNLALLRQIDLLISSLPIKEYIPKELLSYWDKVTDSCNNLRQKVLQSLEDLNKERIDILDDILSNTQKNTREFYLYNSRLVTPLRRFLPSDQLCLKILQWLHSTHPKTKDIPGGFCDGDVGIWPSTEYPIVYFMPSSAQYGLLYLPLFFHEFGHLLYICHKPELDELVLELQKEISVILAPAVQRDDRLAQEDAKRRNIIVETWYEWAQELFCDAVGFQIGGSCFVNAFSMYLKMLGRDRFTLSFNKLAYSAHPVTWLRVHLLVEHLKREGLENNARNLENEWRTIAQALSVTEDYYGFYIDEFLDPILKTVHDMLIETEPYKFSLDNLSVQEIDMKETSPVQFLNMAWVKFYENPEEYQVWERQAISNLLK